MNNLNNLEEWKDIEGYEGYYQISNFGNVKSLPRVVYKSDGTIQTFKEKILKLRNNGYGYLQVNLCKNGKLKAYKVHRLVASAFIDNPNNYEQVNHKDECKTNNKVENLEWCDAIYNMNYGTHNERVTKSMTNNSKISKRVVQIDKHTGEIIKIWPSTNECERNGFKHSKISLCCNGKRKSHKGYIWKYIDNVA